MRQFAKKPALIGGILGIVAALVGGISGILAIGSGRMNLSGITVHILSEEIPNLLSPLALVLLSAALFRGKKDKLAGGLFALQALVAVVTIIAAIDLPGAARKVWFYYCNPENILLAAVYGFLALDSFMEIKMPEKVKMGILVGAVALHFVLDVAGYGSFYAYATLLWNPGRGFNTRVIGRVMPAALRYMIGVLPAALARIFAGIAAVQGSAGIAPVPSVQNSYAQPVSDGPEQIGYISMGKHIALCLLTFGIWPAIWVYKTTDTLNNVPGFPRQSAVSQLLLYLFVPFYAILWYYKQGKRTDAYTAGAGLSGSCATLCLVMGIFLPVVAMIIMQDKINAAARALYPR